VLRFHYSGVCEKEISLYVGKFNTVLMAVLVGLQTSNFLCGKNIVSGNFLSLKHCISISSTNLSQNMLYLLPVEVV